MTDRQTLTHLREPDPRTEPDADEKTVRKLDLSLTQVVGGALAAMTTAALGSRLGVGGTIAGAAFASVVAAVAGALYTASLRSTSQKVKTVWTGPGQRKLAAAAALPAASPAAARPGRLLWTRFSWRRTVVGAVTVFGLAAVLLTGYEALAGHALSGGSGTTVKQVATGNHAGSTSDSKKKSADEEDQPAKNSPEASPSAEGSDQPTESAPSEPAPSEPAPSDPGTSDPGTSDPGTSDPGPGDSAPSSGLPGGPDGSAPDPTTAPTTQSDPGAPAERNRGGSNSSQEPQNANPGAGSSAG